MGDKNREGMPLGRTVRGAEQYAPELLYRIPRAEGRASLGIGDPLPFHGADLWHAYELSWLDSGGKPLSRVGRLAVPADSPNMVESKSLKLYLNSLNNHRFADEAEAIAVISADVGATVDSAVELELSPPDAPDLAGSTLRGKCLDELSVAVPGGQPRAEMLTVRDGGTVSRTWFSHLLRSLCPVTGQPDWATVWIDYRGGDIEPASLLAYILSYRSHQEFHEQCVERMFCDLVERCRPELLQVQAFYTRRGGLDINPFRTTEPLERPLPRLNRQ